MQPRRYKLLSWDAIAGRGIATDGTKYQGEAIEFIVFGRDLDVDYDGHLDVGEEFYANDAPNFVLYDVVVESGPRGLVSQDNFYRQENARKEADKQTPKTIITEAEYQRLTEAQQIIANAQKIAEQVSAVDQISLIRPLTEEETARTTLNLRSYSPSLTVDIPKTAEAIEIFRQDEPGKPFVQTARIVPAKDYNFKFITTPAPSEELRESSVPGTDDNYYYNDRVLRDHMTHLDDILLKQTIQLVLIETYLSTLDRDWLETAKAENRRQVLANQPSVATPDYPITYEETVANEMKGVEKVDEFSNEPNVKGNQP